MSIDGELREALARLAKVDKLLVALDFDGVVAPIVPRAEDARPLPATGDAVVRLAALPTRGRPTSRAGRWRASWPSPPRTPARC
ncbi:hypothetical protein [Sinomonas atrocyanea]